MCVCARACVCVCVCVCQPTQITKVAIMMKEMLNLSSLEKKRERELHNLLNALASDKEPMRDHKEQDDWSGLKRLGNFFSSVWVKMNAKEKAKW